MIYKKWPLRAINYSILIIVYNPFHQLEIQDVLPLHKIGRGYDHLYNLLEEKHFVVL